MTQADFIIVGSGSAGCVLARKLSDADAGHVLVLEARDYHDNTAIHNPAEWATLWDTDVDWGYKTPRRSAPPAGCTTGHAERSSAAPAA